MQRATRCILRQTVGTREADQKDVFAVDVLQKSMRTGASIRIFFSDIDKHPSRTARRTRRSQVENLLPDEEEGKDRRKVEPPEEDKTT